MSGRQWLEAGRKTCVSGGTPARGVLLVRALVAALSALFLGSSALSADEVYRSHFKQRVPLRVDTAQVATYQSPGVPTGPMRAERLRKAGIREETPGSFGIQGWTTAPSPQGRGTLQDLRTLVDDLAAPEGAEFVSPMLLDEGGRPLIVTSDLFVKFREGVPAEQAERILRQASVGTLRQRDAARMRGLFRWRSHARNGFTVLEQANALAERPEVEYAEPDFIVTGGHSLIPEDPAFENSWGLFNTGQITGAIAGVDMRVPEAWDVTLGDPSVIIVVLDTGVQQDHPDLNQISGRDFTGQGGDGGPFNACDRHGTPVAGCISARMNNALGTAGVAPGCRVASARFAITNVKSPCDGSFSFQLSWLVDALDWAQTLGARVTNNSNYFNGSYSVIEDKYAQTRAAGLVHFASAGNNSALTVSYPASLPTVNAVGAVNSNGEIGWFSNRGDVNFAAPGVDIYSTDRTGAAGFSTSDYAWMWGTSFASPSAAAVAALVLSVRPELTPDEVEAVLRESATDLGEPGHDSSFGSGMVNAFLAVRLATATGDLDGDGFVSQADADIFQACSTGPSVPYASLPPGQCLLEVDVQGWLPADFDADGDIDQTDFGQLQAHLTGPP